MKNGFTLAEVLITLGIIGVVASLTLPALIQNQQKHSLEVATKKNYDGSINTGALNPECRKDPQCNTKELHRQMFARCKNSGDYGCDCIGHFIENGFKFDY